MAVSPRRPRARRRAFGAACAAFLLAASALWSVEAPGRGGSSEERRTTPREARLQLLVGEVEAHRAARFELGEAGLEGRHWSLTKGLAPGAALATRGQIDERGALELPLSADWLRTLEVGVHTLPLELELERGAREPGLAQARALSLSIVVEPPRSLGINLAYLDYFSTHLVFRDLFRQASRWIPQEVDGYAWDTGAPLELDERGWVRRLAPGQAAAVLVARDIGGHYPGGRWRVEFAGRGRLEARLDGRLRPAGAGAMHLDVTPSQAGIHLRLIETDPADPVRDIRLYPEPPAAGESPFRPAALTPLEPFQALRFMDWQRTNDSPLERWEQRARPEDARQTSARGVALEYQLALANELGADAWLCVPHRADDDFVRAMALQVRDELGQRRRVYLEYSNEVWNSIFEQARWARERGLEAQLSSDPFQAQLRFYAQRAVEVFAIWSEVFADEPARLVRVLAGPAVNSWAGKQLLDWQDAWHTADAYAIAPYFGHGLGRPERAAQVRELSQAAFLEELDSQMRASLAAVSEHAQLARERGLRLLAYEGGQHLVGHGPAVDDEALTQLFQRANRAPGMGQLYTRSLALWRESGGELFCAWNAIERWTKWGSWSALEHLQQTSAEAPKYDALRRFSLEHPPWWPR